VSESAPAAVSFVLQLGRALHQHGESAQRLEDILVATSARLGLQGAQFFSTPTSILATFGPLGEQRTHMLRVQPGDVNLGTLAALEQVSLEVAQGRRTPQQGSAAIAALEAAPPRYGRALTTLAFGLVSASAAQFLGGGVREVAVAGILGIGLGLFSIFAERHPRVGRVFESLAAFLLSFSAVGLAHLLGPLSVLVATLGGLIVLIPGLTLTTAMTELATRHLASGTARLSGAFITFLGIAFGVALGNRLGGALFGAPPVVEATRLAGWPAIAALLLAPLAFIVILRAEHRDALFIVGAGVIGVLGGRLGAATLGVELGTFAGAFAVALASNSFERLRRRPAVVVLVPGILLLVPGSVGFRSLTSLMERHAVAGVETAFSMILTAIALVAGLLIAEVVAPERRLRGDTKRPVTGEFPAPVDRA